LSTAGDNTIFNKTADISSPAPLDHWRLSTAGYKPTTKIKKTQYWLNGTPVVIVLLVAKQQRIRT
jgi:hypothetical protein